MKYNTGEKVSFRVASGSVRHEATVVSARGDQLKLVMPAEKEESVKTGQCLAVSGSGGEGYFEVADRSGREIILKKMGAERREYFRVDDVFPVNFIRVGSGDAPKKARVFQGYGAETISSELADDTISPQLWKMLCDINAKLSLILEKIGPDRQGLAGAEERSVNVSATGIRFLVNEHVEVGDTVEVKMLLPTLPPVGILTYGDVVRVKDLGNKGHEVAIHFYDMEDDVRDEIIQYTLQRQRQVMRLKKQQSGSDV